MAASGGKPETVVAERGSVGSWSTQGNQIAYAFSTPGDLAHMYLKTGDGAPRKLTDLNREATSGTTVEPVESLTFVRNDNKWTTAGPHGQQRPAFNFRNQTYSSHGWATLMVNYRGSTGYGQAFTDAVFGDQNGNEAQDILYGFSAAMRRNLWIDRERLGVEGGSYGGHHADQHFQSCDSRCGDHQHHQLDWTGRSIKWYEKYFH